jgi:hypothetical protein
MSRIGGRSGVMRFATLTASYVAACLAFRSQDKLGGDHVHRAKSKGEIPSAFCLASDGWPK